MRERIAVAEVLGETEADVVRAYSTAHSEACQELLARWVRGVRPPGDDTHVEAVRLHRAGDLTKVVGFAVYLVSGEPRRLGSRYELVE